jgi:hypothetical protein
MKHTFTEILAKINASLDKDKRWEKSKLRYYLRDVLEEPPQKRGAESTYPDLTLCKLLFISKLMDSNVSPTIRQLKEILANVTDEEFGRIARGEERLEIGVPTRDASGSLGFKTLSGEHLSFNDPSAGRLMQPNMNWTSSVTEFSKKEDDSAAEYVRKFENTFASSSESRPRKRAWESIVDVGDDLRIMYRKKLTRKQETQLRKAAELIASILGEEE